MRGASRRARNVTLEPVASTALAPGSNGVKSYDSRTKSSLELDLLYTQSYILQKLVHTIPVLVPPNLAPCALANTTAAAVSSESYKQDG
jgi:hypothetical protein